MRLADVQRLMRDALLAPPGTESAPVERAALLVHDSPGLPAAEHVRIYRRAVLGTLTRALADIYPVCRRLTGHEFFDAMARVFVRQAPSRSPDLADYGATFGDFIAGFEPATALPYLADVARLEWHWHRAFHAAAHAPLDLAALAAVPEHEQERIGFSLPASARLLESDWPVHRIWQVNQPNYNGDDGVDAGAGPARLIVWRDGQQMRIDALDEREWWLLGALHAGTSLGALGAPPDLPTLLPRCVARGWLADFTVNALQ